MYIYIYIHIYIYIYIALEHSGAVALPELTQPGTPHASAEMMMSGLRFLASNMLYYYSML